MDEYTFEIYMFLSSRPDDKFTISNIKKELPHILWCDIVFAVSELDRDEYITLYRTYDKKTSSYARMVGIKK